jgi:hypothetical protein
MKVWRREQEGTAGLDGKREGAKQEWSGEEQ